MTPRSSFQDLRAGSPVEHENWWDSNSCSPEPGDLSGLAV